MSADGRYGDNPFRLQHYYQYQVVIKPSPPDLIDLYLGSLRAVGIDPLVHDVRLVEDNWESPTLGAWGLGWEIWLNGMEITQFTYFQQVGGLDCRPVMGEITYGLERLAMYLRGSSSVFDLVWTDGPLGRVTYGDVYHQNEVEQSKYNFELADVPELFRQFDAHERMPADALGRSSRCPRMSACSGLHDLQPARCPQRDLGDRAPALYPARARHSRAAWQAYYASREAGLPDGAARFRTGAGARYRQAADERTGMSASRLPGRDRHRRAAAQVAAVAFRRVRGWDCERAGRGGAHTQGHRALRHAAPARGAGAAIDRAPTRPPARTARSPLRAAFDAQGAPTQAALSFAKVCGVEVDVLETLETPKGAWMVYRGTEAGAPTAGLLPAIVQRSLDALPIARRMRWGDGDVQFVRPVHWVLMLFGQDIVDTAILGVPASNVTYGHRFMVPKALRIASAAAYVKTLHQRGKVLVDIHQRRETIRRGVAAAAERLGGHAVVEGRSARRGDGAGRVAGAAGRPLRREISRVAAGGAGRDDAGPPALPVRDGDGALMPWFVAVSNIEAQIPLR